MYSFNYNSQIKRFRTHVDVDTFSRFGTWNACPKSVLTFQLYSVRYEFFMWMTSRYYVSFSFGFWYRVDREMGTNISEHITASVFIPEAMLVYMYQTTCLKPIRPQYEDF
jgi:hypothetical protein